MCAAETKTSLEGLDRSDFELTRGIGTLLWSAPEVLKGLTYGLSADVYRCGLSSINFDVSAAMVSFSGRSGPASCLLSTIAARGAFATPSNGASALPFRMASFRAMPPSWSPAGAETRRHARRSVRSRWRCGHWELLRRQASGFGHSPVTILYYMLAFLRSRCLVPQCELAHD
jgi:hypothetical protein